jgi:hypothetical protein
MRTLLVAFVFFSSLTTSAQTAKVSARVTQPVDATNLLTLQGNTHPLARPEYDQGAAPDSLPMERMLLVLQRSAEQEAALRSLLDEQQIKSSPNYHMWLTPEQFGQQFGPVDADIQAVTVWLGSQGFQVSRVAAGRTVIEFSGTAGAVRQALHTEIHKYAVNGKEYWANASDPQIPAALMPVVAGYASLNNFPREPMIQRVGAFSRSKATGEVKPLFTVTSNNENYYALGPTDFATIYNVLPLWNAGTDGTGQTIAIVAGSNIDIQDVADFRNLFGLPANAPQIIVNGPDPGVTMTDAETEADLDTEWAGAVAKGATIDLVVSEDTEATWGADLSAVYIIDNNLAPILSASFGICEASLGVGGNAFYSSLWEQGAAQGITILVASGDSGSAACEGGQAAAEYGLEVSGTASTPFNVAAGGTDFNDVDTWSTYWSSTNNSTTLSSALSYIPEMTWNDSCARSGVASSCASAGSDTPTGIDLVAGGGGQSNCITSLGTPPNVTCTGGYAKPAWQTGNGVPQDGVRDLPDVSLFASNGFNRSFYALCEADAVPGEISCNQAYPIWVFLGAGGTSVSTPTFAGIMALVNQKTGERQGNANYVLYPLAAKSGASCTSNASMAASANSSACIFYDVVAGNNSVACVGGSPNCSNTTSGGYGILEVNPPANPSPAWTTTAGYDLATGLGSVNAANLVKNWTSVSFNPTTTTLPDLSPTTLTHGQSVNFTVNVAPSSGSGTPTGDVSLIAQAGSSSSNVTGIGSFALSKGSSSSSFSGTTKMLPGGSYGVTAHYAGDGTFGASDSTPPVQVTVNPEGSQTHVALLTFDSTTGQETSSNASSAVYGSPSILRADVANSSGNNCYSVPYACPSGQVTLTDNGQPIDLGTYKLNSEGYTEDQFVLLLGGSNNTVATYSGDSSYSASTSSADTITVTPAPTTMATVGLPSPVVAGNVSFAASISTQSYGVAPTGTVQVSVDGGPLGYPYPILGTPYVPVRGTYASGWASTGATLTGGPHTITQQYSGDTNYAGSTSPLTSITVTDYSLSSNPATISIPAPGQSATATMSITPLYGFAGTGNMQCYNNNPGMSCSITPTSFTLSGSSPVSATVTVSTTAPVSSTAPAPQMRVPPSSHAPEGRHWTLAMMLCLTMLTILAAMRARAAALLLAGALLIMGIWVACGGGGGGGGYTPPPPAPVLGFSTSSLTFSQQNTGTTSAPQTVILSNTGNATLDISNMSISGTNSGDFAQTSNCGNSLVAQNGCIITVTFTPSASGTRSASLTITDNASGSPQSVSLTGTGVTPAVAFSPSSLSFGQEDLNVTTPPRAITLSNTGSSPINIMGIGIPAAYFAETNNCGSSLAAGANCVVTVTFTPGIAGTISAQLVATDSAPGSPQTCNLTGIGVQPTPPGAYTIQIQASSGSDGHTLNVPVTVQ